MRNMAEEDSWTIEVKGISAKTSKDTLENYFSSPRRGGEISSIDYDTTSGTACITFAQPEGAEKALETSPHCIESATVTVQRKLKETLELNKLYIEGLNPKTTHDALLYYIESIISSQLQVTEVSLGTRCNAMITVDGELDFDKVHSRSQAKPLDGNVLRINPVPVCKTILVKNVPDSATRDAVLYKFESVRCGGGKVEKVELCLEERRALVEFKDPTVLDHVLSRSHTLNGVDLTVQRHDPLLGGLINEQPKIDPKVSEPVKTETLTPLGSTKHRVEIDRDLYTYLINYHPANLNLALKDGQSAVDEREDSVVVTMETGDAKNDLEAFLNNYKCEKVDFDPVLVEHGLQRKVESTLEVFKSSKAVSLQAYYSKGYIKIPGRAVNTHNLAVEEVNKCVRETREEYEEKTKRCEDVIEVSPAHLKLLQKSPKYHTSERGWKEENVEVRIDDAGGGIAVKGSQNQLNEIRNEIQSLVHSFGEHELERKTSLLLTSPVAVSYVKDLLLENHLDIELSTSDSERTVLRGLDKSQVDKAHRLILGVVREIKLPLSDIGPRYRNKESREEFVSDVGPSIPMSLHVEDDELRVVCFEKDLSNLRLQVAHFLEKKKHDKIRVPLEKAVARYFHLHGESIVEGLTLSSPGISIEQASDAMIISGPKPLVDACRASIHKLVRELCIESMNFGTPETCASITGETAEKIILGIEQAHTCAIVVNVREEKEERANRPGSSSTDTTDFKEAMNRTLQCRYVYPNGKVIELHQGDILSHPIDFLVNSANEEMKHAGGIAKAIVDKGGAKIQQDCFKLLRDKGQLKLIPGDVVTTDGGNLLCKKILHVVVPKWSSKTSDNATECEGTKEGRYLRHGCLRVLNEAREGKTVAIPMLGTGIYNIPHAISAKSLVGAADEFMRENSHYELREVHFVDNDPTAVKALMNEMMERYGKDFNFEINERVRDRWIPPPKTDKTLRQPPSTHNSNITAFVTEKGMEIRLIIGNIAKCETDVIVNTVHSDLVLTKNPCSKAILEKAGKPLEDLCQKWVQTKGKLQEGSFAVTDGAKLKCKKVFHVCCPHWKADVGEQMLRQLVQNVLSEVKTLKFTSVAIPALGTGSLKFPVEIVANVLFEEAMRYSAKEGASANLKQFNIVVYRGNATAVEKFKEKFQFYSAKRGTQPPVRRTQRKVEIEQPTRVPTPRRISEGTKDDVPFESSGLKIEIVQGDMVQESTDAITFLVGNNIREGGQIGLALLKEAGDSLEHEYNGINKIDSGSVVMTSAGNLKAKCLLHMVPKKSIFTDTYSSKSIKESVINCLNDADSYQLKSIALPAVGTGQLKKGAKESAEIVHESITEYARRPIRSLELIRIVILQPTVYHEFYATFLEKQRSNPISCQPVKAENDGGTPTNKNRASSTAGTGRMRRRITLDIVGHSSSHVDKIKEDLNKIEKESCEYQTIENETISELPPKYLKEIVELQNQCSVLIEMRPKMGYLRLSGLSKNVVEASKVVYEKMFTYQRERHNVVLSSQAVQWMFYDDSGGEIVIPQTYSAKTSAEIEKAHTKKEATVVVGGDAKLRIDFATMVETDVNTGATMKVYRSSREGFPLPRIWDCQPIVRATGQELQVYLADVDITSHDEEYDKIYDMFKKTMPNASVNSIQRIQNPRLYQIYKGQQKKMDERGECNEQKLFHGTTKETVENINNSGLNRAYCGKNATKYGKGVYFARNAKYSARRIYATPDDTGLQYMYVARVLVGHYTKGKEGIIVPPPIDDNNPTVCYDSVVDDVLNPAIFVIFYDYQCYPEYLITFKDKSTR